MLVAWIALGPAALAAHANAIGVRAAEMRRLDE